ncbi:hypothetical protein G647_00909 [Cladophialophora carrionii CBS 160.54]|uniref:Trichothecene 3-O-acetyltransferase n=1 Tax=Cladophialophora carrionii CBS 160.54 TaxID=1279043 RepID=V9DNK5_9EURO|nr:uncharacterized protein G647_00909 [Cladophialophora carrionii CBS 160.54]ETI28460.1 hypothetical protein G647_00909 [Cladophialophora carrionii CBS 160.54]
MVNDERIVFPGPPFRVDLAAIDAIHPIHYSRRLLIFRCASPAQPDAQLSALKTALRELVQRCPLLGGIVAPLTLEEGEDVDPNWRTILPGDGMELIVKDLRHALPSFGELETEGFPVDKLPYNLLVPVPQDIGNDRLFAACKLQFTVIEGGSILTWAMSHSVADGSGNNELMRILAEETHLTQNHSDEDTSTKAAPASPAGLDRSVMRNITSDVPFRIEDHPGYIASAPIQPPFHPFAAGSAEVSVLLHLPASRVAQLKADAQQPRATPISTHDAIAALIWRSAILIRSRRSASAQSIPPSTQVKLFMPSDARRHLHIPDSYIGNAVYQLSASLALGDILSPTGLQEAASAIRSTINAVTPEKVRSLMARTNQEWVDWAFLGSYTSTGVPMGTDWTSSSLYEHDWGKAFGCVTRFRYPGDEGSTCILPKLRDGSAEVMVAVMKNEVDVLKGEECFGQYLR